MNDGMRRKSSWIPSGSVKTSAAPVLISGSEPGGKQAPVRVVPVLEEGVVKYLEIHCTCGNTTVVECVYDEEETP